MGTKCKFKNGSQIFSGAAQHISVGGNITTNQQVANDTAETAVLSDTVYGSTLNNVNQAFRVVIGGEISSGGSGDITLTLRYGTTDILAVVTAALANEDDKPFRMVIEGHVLTAGASGKVLAVGHIVVGQGTVLQFMADTANTGASVDLTADSTLNVTAHWDNKGADDDIICTYGWIEYYH